jgi:heat shock protein HtpX
MSIYQTTTADWRALIQLNKRRTLFIIASFVLIYMLIGLLVDIYLASAYYPQASLSQLFFALLTFTLLPKATLVTVAIALISLLITFSFHDKLMLLGIEYREITPTTAKTLPDTQLYNVVN